MCEGRWVMAELRGKAAPPPSPVSVQQAARLLIKTI
jgi:hypothetical protein